MFGKLTRRHPQQQDASRNGSLSQATRHEAYLEQQRRQQAAIEAENRRQLNRYWF